VLIHSVYQSNRSLPLQRSFCKLVPVAARSFLLSIFMIGSDSRHGDQTSEAASVDMERVISIAKRRAELSGDQKTMAFLEELAPHLLKASQPVQPQEPVEPNT